jgi:FkbM family methyltransferase
MSRLLESLRKTKRYVQSFGSRQGLALLAREAQSGATEEVTVSGGSLQRPVVLRTNSSDMETFRKVIAEREYELAGVTPPRTIVDAGANIGLASLFFAQRFPEARIISLEPESANFELLRRNTRDYPNVVCLHKALWSESGTVNIFDPGEGSWSFRTASQGDPPGAKRVGSIDCINVRDLMSEFGLTSIDLLKIDIEGAEKEVFESSASWIGDVDVIAIELHDRFKRGCSQAFYNATAGFEHELHRGENVFVYRQRARAQRAS